MISVKVYNGASLSEELSLRGPQRTSKTNLIEDLLQLSHRLHNQYAAVQEEEKKNRVVKKEKGTDTDDDKRKNGISLIETVSVTPQEDLEDIKVEEKEQQYENGYDVDDHHYGSANQDAGSPSQGAKGNHVQNLCKEKQNKRHGIQWILSSIMTAASVSSVLYLDDIEEQYYKDCHAEKKEPLDKAVFARLIHELFPEAGKNQPGFRGKQTTYYTGLQWKKGNFSIQQQSECTEAAVNAQQQSDTENGKISTDLQSDDDKPDAPSREVTQNSDVAQEGISLQTEEESNRKQPISKSGEENEEETKCKASADHLAKVIKRFKLDGNFDQLQKTFAHSSSCNNKKCNPLCHMFGRVREHILGSPHPCHVMMVYRVLLKIHVSRCTNDECGIVACPSLRASQHIKRKSDDLIHQVTQNTVQHPKKRLTLEIKHPSSTPYSPSTVLSSPVVVLLPSPPISPQLPGSFDVSQGKGSFMLPIGNKGMHTLPSECRGA